MMDSLFAKYFKERQGIETLFSESGFVTYKISNAECFIVDMYIESSLRGRGHGRRLIGKLKEIALKEGCDLITANIHLADKGANNTLLAAQEVGFVVSSANNNILLISKKTKENHDGR